MERATESTDYARKYVVRKGDKEGRGGGDSTY